jgi:LPS-assembly protein
VQSDVSAAWPIINQWSAFARFNYDHANNRTLESMAGLEYDSCCWATRVVYREWIDTFELNQFVDGRYNAGLFIEFELKGFGSILGGNVQSILENSISGFSAR